MKIKLKKLKQMYKDLGYNKQFIILFIIIELTAIIEIITIPNITKRIINVEIPRSNIKALIILGGIYIIFLFIQCYFVYTHCNIRATFKRKVQRDLREKVFNKLQEVKSKFYDENETGTILNFLQEDVNSSASLFFEIIVEMYFMGLMRFSIIIIFFMFIQIRITLYILLLYLVGFITTMYFNKKTINLIDKIRKINIELYNYINDGIQGFLTIKSLNIIAKKEEELNKKLEEYNNSNDKLEDIVAKYNNIFSFIISFAIPIIIYYSGINIIQGTMSYAGILLLLEYIPSLEHEFKWFIKHLTNFDKSFLAYSKILDFINLDSIEETGSGDSIEKINLIEYENVYFSYNENQKNIEDFSLKIKENEKVALVGRTGSGKTTIVNLLCKFYEPTKGKIKINNINYLKYDISSLRSRIGYVMQDIQILPNSIIDNIKYVNEDITLEEIQNIFKKLKLHNKILNLEDGYNTDIFNNPDILSMRRKTND